VQPVDDVGADQGGEEHAVRREEGPHEELLVRNTRRGGVIVMVINGAGVSAHAKKVKEKIKLREAGAKGSA
jgi:hypothetical protein